MHWRTAELTASARSASSSTTLGDLPLSSSVTRLTVSAARAATRRPARVEPVKETTSTSGWPTSASPAARPRPVTTLSTPGGRPASSAASARRKAERGATSLGFRTTVHPAASAGATLATAWWSG